MNGTFTWSKVESFNTNLTATNICEDGVHPNASGIQLLMEKLWGYFSKNFFLKKIFLWGYFSNSEIKPRKRIRKIMDVWVKILTVS